MFAIEFFLFFKFICMSFYFKFHYQFILFFIFFLCPQMVAILFMEQLRRQSLTDPEELVNDFGEAVVVVVAVELFNLLGAVSFSAPKC